MNNLDMIKKHIENPNSKSFIIDEEWGIGKTTEIKKINKQLKENYPEKTVIYIKISELIDSSIKEICYSEYLDSEKNQIKGTFSLLDKLTKNIKNIQDVEINYIRNISDIIYKRELKKFNLDDYIIFIDEIERVEDHYDIKKLFNDVFELKESDFNLNLFLIFNSSGFTEKNKLVYELWADKISDFNLNLNYLASQELLNIELKKLNSRFNSNLVLKTKEKNIRKIKNVFLELEYLFFKIEERLKLKYLCINEWRVEKIIKEKIENINTNYDFNSLFKHNFFSNDIRLDFEKIIELISLRNEVTISEISKYNSKILDFKNDILKKAEKENAIIDFFKDYNLGVSLINVLSIQKKYLINNLIKKPDDSDLYILKLLFFFDFEYRKKLSAQNKKTFINKLENIKNKEVFLDEIATYAYSVKSYNNPTNEFDDEDYHIEMSMYEDESAEWYYDSSCDVSFCFFNLEYFKKNVTIDKQSYSYENILFLIEQLRSNNIEYNDMVDLIYRKYYDSIDDLDDILNIKDILKDSYQLYLESEFDASIFIGNENEPDITMNDLIENFKEHEYAAYDQNNSEIDQNFEFANYIFKEIIKNYESDNLDKEIDELLNKIVIE